MSKRIPALAAALALLALPLLTACGGSGSSPSASAAARPAARATTVRTASTGLGTILVASGGRTVYLFAKDRGPHSSCSGACLAEWPAVTTHGRPRAAGGATASELGTTQRGDGTTQVTYAGHPLYAYSGDGAAGDTNGQGLDAFGAKWFALAPGGTAITRQASGSSGGYGY